MAVHTSRYEQRPPSPGSPNASGKVEETNDKVATPTASWRGRRSALCACDLTDGVGEAMPLVGFVISEGSRGVYVQGVS